MDSLRTFFRKVMAVALVAAILWGGYWLYRRLTTEERDEHGMTALMRAAQAGEAAQVRELIRKRADVNARVPRQDVRAIIAFISWMQDIPKRDDDWTPLLYAVRGGHVETAKVLLEAGADASLKGRGDVEEALTLAVLSSEPEMVTLILGALPQFAPETQAAKDRALFAAVGRADAATVRQLLAAGASANGDIRWLRTSEPLSPLLVAAQRGEPEIVRMLLAAGANVHVRDRRGWTPLAWAVERRHEAVATLLRNAGAKQDLVQENALLDAIRREDLEAVQAALASGANSDTTSQTGDFPLMEAAERGNAAIVRALLENRAQVNRRHDYMGTALTAAATKGNVEVVRMLVEAGANVRDPKEVALPRAAHYGRLEVVQYLLSAGANPNGANGEALIAASWQGHLEVVQALLAAGANPNLRGVSGNTALIRASGSGHVEVVRLLLEKGADPNLSDDIDTSALTMAAALDHTEIVRMLLGRGADPNHKDSDQKTALYYAQKKGNSEMEQALRAAGARE
jgi:hypothetical protein